VNKRNATRQPLYMQIAHKLTKGIDTLRYPIGSLLPTEENLCAKFGVSRHTIREAIRHMSAQGLLSARRGIGTRVESRNTRTRYSSSLHSLSQVMQYDEKALLQIVSLNRLVADRALSTKLGASIGKPWVHVQGVRYSANKSFPKVLTDIYINKAFGGVAKDPSVAKIPIYKLIERKYGETVGEIQQDIKAVLIMKKQAESLKVKANSPGLMITRRYFGAGGRLIEVTFNLHPASSFTYSMSLKRHAIDKLAQENSA
jgi:GntR family transcriptional regulator